MNTGTCEPLILQSIISLLKKAVKESKIDIYSPFNIITKSMEILENVKGLSGQDKKTYIINAIEEVAKGEDGIAGTADDLIPITTIKKLRAMIENNMVGETIDLIIDVTKGEFNINNITNRGIQLFGKCCGKN